jgi:hypothetical protein
MNSPVESGYHLLLPQRRIVLTETQTYLEQL